MEYDTELIYVKIPTFRRILLPQASGKQEPIILRLACR